VTDAARSWLLAGLGAALLAALVGACGIPTDHSPRPLDRNALPAALAQGTTTTKPAPTDHQMSVGLYLLQTSGTTERLKKVSAVIAYTTDGAEQAREAITRLIAFQPPPSGPTTNPIPSTVHIRSIKLEDGILDLDVTNLDSVQSDQQRIAFAQIVFTATYSPDVLKVRFAIDGQPTQVPLSTGTSKSGEAVDRDDFKDLEAGS
jgi:spore germination protein GerM